MLPALLNATVEFSTCTSGEPITKPPPVPVIASLPEIVLLLIVTVAPLIPSPPVREVATLPEIVEPEITVLPVTDPAPLYPYVPEPPARFPTRLLSYIFSGPLTLNPPPNAISSPCPAALLLIVLWLN